MATTPTPAAPQPPRRDWKPSRRTWLLIGAAFAIGLVLFFVAIRSSRETGFFRAGDVPPSADEPDYTPLPAPMAGEDGSGIGVIEPPPMEAATPQPEVIERPAPPEPIVRREPEPESRGPSVADRKARPLPGQTPSPEYPIRALRNGDRGTVLVLVYIGPDGVPTATEVAQSSGSRELDRAAVQGVRRWRFEPAIADGRPTVGQVVVPIDFSLD